MDLNEDIQFLLQLTEDQTSDQIINCLLRIENQLETLDKKLVKQQVNLESILNSLILYYYNKYQALHLLQIYSDTEFYLTYDRIPVQFARLVISMIRLSITKFPLVTQFHDLLDQQPNKNSQIVLNFTFSLLNRLVQDDQFIFIFGTNIQNYLLKSAKIYFQLSTNSLNFALTSNSVLIQFLLLKSIGFESHQPLIGINIKTPIHENLTISQIQDDTQFGEQLMTHQFDKLKQVTDIYYQTAFLIYSAATIKFAKPTADLLTAASKSTAYCIVKLLRFALAPPGLISSTERCQNLQNQLEKFINGGENYRKNEQFKLMDKQFQALQKEMPGVKYVQRLRESCQSISKSFVTMLVRMLSVTNSRFPVQFGIILGDFVGAYNSVLYVTEMFEDTESNFFEGDLKQFSFGFLSVNLADKLPFALFSEGSEVKLKGGLSQQLEVVSAGDIIGIKVQKLLEMLYCDLDQVGFQNQIQVSSERNNKDKGWIQFVSYFEEKVRLNFEKCNSANLNSVSVIQNSENIDFLFGLVSLFQADMGLDETIVSISLVIKSFMAQQQYNNSCVSLSLLVKSILKFKLFSHSTPTKIIQQAVFNLLEQLLEQKQINKDYFVQDYMNNFKSPEFSILNFIPYSSLSVIQLTLEQKLVHNKQQYSKSLFANIQNRDLNILVQLFSFILYIIDDNNDIKVQNNVIFYDLIIKQIIQFIEQNSIIYPQILEENFNYVILQIINLLVKHHLSSIFSFIALFQSNQIKQVIQDELVNLSIQYSYENQDDTFVICALFSINGSELDQVRSNLIYSKVISKSMNFLPLSQFLRLVNQEKSIENQIQLFSLQRLMLLLYSQNQSLSNTLEILQIIFDEKHAIIDITEKLSIDYHQSFQEYNIFEYISQLQYGQSTQTWFQLLQSIVVKAACNVQLTIQDIHLIQEKFGRINFHFQNRHLLFLILRQQINQYQDSQIFEYLLSNFDIIQSEHEIQNIIFKDLLGIQNVNCYLLTQFLKYATSYSKHQIFKYFQNNNFTLDKLLEKELLYSTPFYSLLFDNIYSSQSNSNWEKYYHETFFNLQILLVQHSILKFSQSYLDEIQSHCNLQNENYLSNIYHYSIYQVLFTFTNYQYPNSNLQQGKDYVTEKQWVQLLDKQLLQDIRYINDEQVDKCEFLDILKQQNDQIVFKQISRSSILNSIQQNQQFQGIFKCQWNYLPTYVTNFSINLSFGFKTLENLIITELFQKSPQVQSNQYLSTVNFTTNFSNLLSLINSTSRTPDQDDIIISFILDFIEVWILVNTNDQLQLSQYLHLIILFDISVQATIFKQFQKVLQQLQNSSQILQEKFIRIINILKDLLNLNQTSEKFIYKNGILQFKQTSNQPILNNLAIKQHQTIQIIAIEILSQLLHFTNFSQFERQIQKMLTTLSEFKNEQIKSQFLYHYLSSADIKEIQFIAKLFNLNEFYQSLIPNKHQQIMMNLISVDLKIEQDYAKLITTVIAQPDQEKLIEFLLPYCEITEPLTELINTTPYKTLLTTMATTKPAQNLFQFLSEITEITEHSLDYLLENINDDSVDFTNISNFHFQIDQNLANYIAQQFNFSLPSIKFLVYSQIIFSLSFDGFFAQIPYFTLDFDFNFFQNSINLILPIVSQLPNFSIQIFTNFVEFNSKFGQLEECFYVQILSQILKFFNFGTENEKLLGILQDKLETEEVNYEIFAILAGASGSQIEGFERFGDNVVRAVGGDFERDEGIKLKFGF